MLDLAVEDKAPAKVVETMQTNFHFYAECCGAALQSTSAVERSAAALLLENSHRNAEVAADVSIHTTNSTAPQPLATIVDWQKALLKAGAIPKYLASFGVGPRVTAAQKGVCWVILITSRYCKRLPTEIHSLLSCQCRRQFFNGASLLR